MDALRTLEILITSRTPFIAIEQAVVTALYTAFARRAELTTEHILEEIKATRPLSVTRAEDIDALREWAKGRTVPAS
jgi:hypothetical protein